MNTAPRRGIVGRRRELKLLGRLLDADNLRAAFDGLATSTDPLDTWYRELTREIHGIDLEGGLRPPEQTADYRRDAGTAVQAPAAAAGTVS